MAKLSFVELKILMFLKTKLSAGLTLVGVAGVCLGEAFSWNINKPIRHLQIGTTRQSSVGCAYLLVEA